MAAQVFGILLMTCVFFDDRCDDTSPLGMCQNCLC